MKTIFLSLTDACPNPCKGGCQLRPANAEVFSAAHFKGADCREIVLCGGEVVTDTDLLKKAIRFFKRRAPVKRQYIHTCFHAPTRDLAEAIYRTHGVMASVFKSFSDVEINALEERVQNFEREITRMTCSYGRWSDLPGRRWRIRTGEDGPILHYTRIAWRHFGKLWPENNEIKHLIYKGD